MHPQCLELLWPWVGEVQDMSAPAMIKGFESLPILSLLPCPQSGHAPDWHCPLALSLPRVDNALRLLSQSGTQVTMAGHTGLGGNVSLQPSGTENVARHGRNPWAKRRAFLPRRGARPGARLVGAPVRVLVLNPSFSSHPVPPQLLLHRSQPLFPVL